MAATEQASAAQEKVADVAGQAKEQAQQAAGQARTRIQSTVNERTTQAGQQVTSQASDLRTVGETLREQGKTGPAKIADQAADRVEKVGSYLENADADAILRDVENFGRQRPWAIIAGGTLLGIAASRFLKASSQQRFQTSSGTTGRVGADEWAATVPQTPSDARFTRTAGAPNGTGDLAAAGAAAPIAGR